LSLKGELRREEACLSNDGGKGTNIALTSCRDNEKQIWAHDKVSGFHIKYPFFYML